MPTETRAKRGLVSGVVVATVATMICVTASAQQDKESGRNISATMQAASRSLTECAAPLYADAKYAEITSHFPANGTETSLAQLGDDSLATKKQIALILEYDAAQQVCRLAYVKEVQSVLPTLAAILQDEYTKLEFNTLDLIKKKIAWGIWSKKRKEITTELGLRWTAESQRIQRGQHQ